MTLELLLFDSVYIDHVGWEGTLRQMYALNVEEMIPAPPLTDRELVELCQAHGVEWDPKHIWGRHELEILLARAGFMLQGDNTYNYGWWGPVLNWQAFELGDRVLVSIKKHLGGDVRRGYSEPVFFEGIMPEDLPIFTASLALHFEDPNTRESLGVATAVDVEAVHFEMAQTGFSFDLWELCHVTPWDVTMAGEDGLLIELEGQKAKDMLRILGLT